LDQPDPVPPPAEAVVGNLLDWEALATRLTPADNFFTVKHYDLPMIDPASWQLGIHGLVRRELSLSLKTITALKFNHDTVVPKGRIPELFALVRRIREEYRLRIPLFGHAGDGNIHVNIMVDPDDEAEIARAHAAERVLFEGVVALEGSISGEHGIGFSKMPFIPLELSPDEIALMKRVKQAFDPLGILNPGKMFP
jgi:FAD/FMN-containing dehydrogenase